MKIYIITDQISGMKWYYTSITAVLEDVENPLEISNRRWSQIVKEKGYPFFHSGCKIEMIIAKTTSDIRNDNPAIII
jgi:hypothetical protein